MFSQEPHDDKTEVLHAADLEEPKPQIPDFKDVFSTAFAYLKEDSTPPAENKTLCQLAQLSANLTVTDGYEVARSTEFEASQLWDTPGITLKILRRPYWKPFILGFWMQKQRCG